MNYQVKSKFSLSKRMKRTEIAEFRDIGYVCVSTYGLEVRRRTNSVFEEVKYSFISKQWVDFILQ